VCEVLAWLDVVDLLRAMAVCRLWHTLITSPFATSTSNAFALGPAALYYAPAPSSGGGPLWRRAYLRTWPLPELPPPPHSLPPTTCIQHKNGCYCRPLVLCDLSEEVAQLQAQKAKKNTKKEQEEGQAESSTLLDWMTIAKERLQLQYNGTIVVLCGGGSSNLLLMMMTLMAMGPHTADRTKAPAIIKALSRLRAYGEEGQKRAGFGRGDFVRVKKHAKALKEAIRVVRRQEKLMQYLQDQVLKRWGYDPLTTDLFSCLLPGTYLFNTYYRKAYASPSCSFHSFLFLVLWLFFPHTHTLASTPCTTHKQQLYLQ
jgi:hypothetical protein